MTVHFGRKSAFAALTFSASLFLSTAGLAQTYSQSPLYDAMADLPAVPDRLPAAPLVLTPVESVGNTAAPCAMSAPMKWAGCAS